MLLKNFLLGTSLAALANAIPTSPAPTDDRDEAQKPAAFGLIAIHSTSPVHNAGISASNSRLWINRDQDADCDKETNFATFSVNDMGLYLYNENATGMTAQQFYVDRSGMGQGITGYTTGDEGYPRNGERYAFAVNNGRLQFDGEDWQACPLGDGSYYIWLGTFNKPGQNEGCIPIVLKTIPTEDPISCVYTQQ